MNANIHVESKLDIAVARIQALETENERLKKTLAHIYELALTEDGLADFDADSIRDVWKGYVSVEELTGACAELGRTYEMWKSASDELLRTRDRVSELETALLRVLPHLDQLAMPDAQADADEAFARAALEKVRQM